MQLAIEHAGKQAIVETLQDALVPFTGTDGQIMLPPRIVCFWPPHKTRGGRSCAPSPSG